MNQPLQSDIDKAMQRLNRWDERKEGTLTVAQVRDEMQKIMQEDFGVFRTHDSMAEGVKALAELAKAHQEGTYIDDHSRTFNTARIEALELDNLLATAQATAHAALTRTESRGAHSRVDYPDRDDEAWHCHLLIDQAHNTTKRSVNMQPLTVDPFL